MQLEFDKGDRESEVWEEQRINAWLAGFLSFRELATGWELIIDGRGHGRIPLQCRFLYGR